MKKIYCFYTSIFHRWRIKKPAFTLAEVLITLGIIGVVAAMTLPSLIQKYNKTVVETRLKKFYSEINQAILMAEKDYGDKIYWQPEDTEDFWTTYLKPYLNYIKTEDKDRFKIIYFENGSAVRVDIYYQTTSTGETYVTGGGHFIFCPEAKYCAANYTSDKNMDGIKRFYFAFWPNEDMQSGFEYHRNRGVEPYLVWWDGEDTTLYTSSKYGCIETPINNRFYCTAIIKRNGWKIPDDYPFQF